ncbi:MAG: UDP-N-acetylmuramoyl-L-alanyl-D-glutamate--2,6-diaminopimelate ligase [Paludibacteraceae bacterium]|nr:UDP-N-acetylmuramoyl-L-alanyl-D-glutamate--2,6-diaminopimelate ligase [Paludibacteraceae bacterium]
MKIDSLLKEISIKQIEGKKNPDINNIQFDSRKITENDLFVAIKGTQSDGHDYIETAIENGARCVVCETLPDKCHKDVTYILVDNSSEALGLLSSAFFGYPSSKMVLVGVTGTNGKTTIATLLYQMFRKFGHKSGLLSTVCNYVNDRKSEATHTTPDPIELNRLLKEMVDEGCEYAFMEVSSHAIEQRRIAGLQFDGGIFTNLTRDHIDYHKTFENYLNAKKKFFDNLPAEAFALTNIDDKNGSVMLQNTKARKHTYSIREMADFKTKIMENSFEGMSLDINGIEVQVPFIGKFNAQNLTAVYGATVLLGKSKMETIINLSALTPVSGRFEYLRSPKGWTAIVDYAHTPDALNNVIGTINQIQNGKGELITVVGCGGNRDKGKRPMMAKEAVNGSEKCIFTSDNPRDENPEDILKDMIAGLDNEDMEKVLVISDRKEAIKTACMLAHKNDVILVAGKGHEDYQIIKGEKTHFDDKETILRFFY